VRILQNPDPALRAANDECKKFLDQVDQMHVLDFLSYRLGMLSRIIDRGTEKRLGNGLEIGLTETRLLSFLCINSPTTIRAIAAEMHLDKAQVSRAAAGLVKLGLAHREADPKDRRSATFVVTGAGQDYYNKQVVFARRGQKALLSQLDADEYAALSNAIDTLLAYGVEKSSKKK